MKNFFSALFLVLFSASSFAQIGFLQGTQALISRDQTGECCSGNNYTLALAESTIVTGKKASISFHNLGYDEGKLELSRDAGFRSLKLYDNQGLGLGLHVVGQGLFSRDNVFECCSGLANYTLAIAENTILTGKRASISFHNQGNAEGRMELSTDGGFRNIKFTDAQGVTLGLNVTGNVLIGNTAIKSGYKLFVEQGIVTEKLEVTTDAAINGSLASRLITVLPENNVGEGGEIRLKGSLSTLKGYNIDTFYNQFRIFTGNSIRFMIADNGNIGIGTTNPDDKLTVKGKIHAEEIRVDLQVPADYVFEKYYVGKSTSKPDYKMLPLAEVEKYTKINNHLPDVPSAQEIKENGLNVGQMSNILLQKVEELTLYIIEMNKQLSLQKEHNDKLDEKLRALQDKINK
jgi:hypothetical protein